MKRLTVLSVGYPFAPVCPDTAGGAEQVLALIDCALTRAGHRSIVLAPHGSSVRGELIPSAAVPHMLDPASRSRSLIKFQALLEAVLHTRPIDLLHFHGVDFSEYLPHFVPPSVVTLHLPPNWYPQKAFACDPDQVKLVCVSQSQQSECAAGAVIQEVIPNGVPLDRFYPDGAREDYVAAMGRVCPEKGFHHALDAATQCGRSLLLAGHVFPYPAHRQYFEREIQPRLGNGHRFIGQIGGETKRRFLARAHCLVIASKASETSSLSAMEAMACGTPVIAFRVGALPEIIEHGRTGWLVNRREEIADAIQAAGEIRSEECRRAAEERFSAERMTQSYLRLYSQLAAMSANLQGAA